MSRQNSNHQALWVGMTDIRSCDTSIFNTASLSVRRLVVLVPTDSHYGYATQQIRELAEATGLCVQLLGICKHRVKEPSLRRQLILMTALLQDSGISTEAKIEIGSNWIDALRRIYQTSDMIVCFAQQRVGFLNKPLDQTLENYFDAPIFVLAGPYPHSSSKFEVLSTILLWLGFISVITVAFLFQIRILALTRTWVQMTLMIMVVMMELLFIWVWNNLFI